MFNYHAHKKLLAFLPVLLSACTELTTPPQTYNDFLQVNQKDYPTTMEVFMDKELLKKATPQSIIHVCLEQQRGRLYVNEQVAADWPVSTGKAGKETPVGTFRILEKKKKYASSTWGVIVDENDICLVSGADSRVDKVPPGGEFLGSRMDNWQRLTDDGVGIHTGKVRAGKGLSQGCIRTPGFIADTLFDITDIGSEVIISQEPEAAWPGHPQQEK